MKNVILLLLILFLAGLCFAADFFFEAYNVAEIRFHTDLVAWFLDKAQTNSIQMREAVERDSHSSREGVSVEEDHPLKELPRGGETQPRHTRLRALT